MDVSIHLVAWNGETYVADCIATLARSVRRVQSEWGNAREIYFLAYDNASTDRTREILAESLVDFPCPSRLIAGTVNSGFAGGHNALFAQTDAEYALIVNQDAQFDESCLVELVRVLDEHSELAVVAPRIMRPDGTTVDSLGLAVFHNRHVEDIASGCRYSDVHGSKEHVQRIFGASGAVALLRMKDLREIAFSDGSIFDDSYHSYKEDVDLAYRLQSHGRKAGVALDAVAYHHRSIKKGERKTRAPFIEMQSYRNHLMTLFKNEYWQNALLDLPFLLWYEGRKILYALVSRPHMLAAWIEIARNWEKIMQKRKRIASLRRVSWRDLRKWWRA